MATALECSDSPKFDADGGFSPICTGDDELPFAWWLFFEAKDLQVFVDEEELEQFGFVRARNAALELAQKRLVALQPELTARTAETIRRFIAHVAKSKSKFLVLNAGWDESKAELLRRVKWFEKRNRAHVEELFDLSYEEDEDGKQRIDLSFLELLVGEVTQPSVLLTVPEDATVETPATVATAPELLEPVYANPFDVSTRLVCADQLLERNDPRGELIRLQCTPNLTTRQQRRLSTVWESLRETLAAPFAPAKVLFQRGFATEVAFESRPDTLRTSAPWTTVHTLTLEGRAEFLTLPCLSGVKRLITAPNDLLALRTAVNFESVGVDQQVIDAAVWMVLADRQLFPKLAEVITPKTLSVWLPPPAMALLRARPELRITSADQAFGRLLEHPPLGLRGLTAEEQQAREHEWANPKGANLAGARWDSLGPYVAPGDLRGW